MKKTLVILLILSLLTAFTFADETGSSDDVHVQNPVVEQSLDG